MTEAALNPNGTIVTVKTRRGQFRIQLSGNADDLQAIGPTLDRLAGAAEGPDDFLIKAMPELARHNVMVAEVFDVGPKAPQLSLVDRVRAIMNIGPRATAEDSYLHLRVTFQIAEPEEIDALLSNPEDLSFVSNYVHAVLDDLDENRLAAVRELHEVLGPTVAPVIVGWPEDT
jgi:hypothetical protein